VDNANRGKYPQLRWVLQHTLSEVFAYTGIEMVVVKLSSHPVAGAAFSHPLTLRAWAALAQAVRQ
jgi:hypothetical protein